MDKIVKGLDFIFGERLPRLLAFICGAYFLTLYLLPPIRFYQSFYLMNFDYGILFQSSKLISQFKPLFLTNRGVHAWADNQDFFQFMFSWLHYFSNPHYALITAHSLAIFSCGIFVLYYLRKTPWRGLGLSISVWLSLFLLNMNMDLIHTEAYATILLLLTFLQIQRGKAPLFYLFFVLAIICKEDVAITASALCLFTLWKHADFKLHRKHLLIAIGLAAVLFVTNRIWVQPYFAAASCEWMGDPAGTQALSHPGNHWFSDLHYNWNKLDFYQRKLFRPELSLYLLKLLWPLLLVGRSAFPFILLPLPAAMLNALSGSGYLVQAYFHYDHSSFAMIIICLLLGLGKRWPKRPRLNAALIILLLAGSLYPHFYMENNMALRVQDPFKNYFWRMGKTDRTLFIESLRDALPENDVVISADYNSAVYFLPGKNDVYMFEGPQFNHYFGVFGLCEEYNNRPETDLVVVRLPYDIKPEAVSWLRDNFTAFSLTLNQSEIVLALHRSSPHRPEMLIAIDQSLRQFNSALTPLNDWPPQKESENE